MKAWQVPELGEPRDVLTLAEVPDPVPGPGQVLVRVLGAAANFPDVLMCRGGYQVRPPLPFTPGVELCGEVVAAGAGVTGVALGDRLIGGAIGGAFAELTLMNAASALPAPPGLDDAEAAALLHHVPDRVVRAAPAGPAGGRARPCWCTPPRAASAAARSSWARRPGARVIGVAGGAEKAEVARDARRGRGGRPAHPGLRRGGQGGHRAGAAPTWSTTRSAATPTPAVHQVHRVRGPDPGHRLRRRADPVGRAEPRAGQELLDRGPALGPVPEQEPPADQALPRRS